MKIFNFLRARFRKFLNEEQWLKDHVKAGMKIGTGCDIHPSLMVDYSHCWLIEIGNHVTLAPQVYFLAQDASTKRYLNYTKIGE
jgi:maltose O-acetyltransferase